jgi:hypothetical protein
MSIINLLDILDFNGPFIERPAEQFVKPNLNFSVNFVVVRPISDSIKNVIKYIFGEYPNATHILKIDGETNPNDVRGFKGVIQLRGCEEDLKKFQSFPNVEVIHSLSDSEIDFASYPNVLFHKMKLRKSLHPLSVCKYKLAIITYDPNCSHQLTGKNIGKNIELRYKLEQQNLDFLLELFERIDSLQLAVRSNIVINKQTLARLKVDKLSINIRDCKILNSDWLMACEYPKNIVFSAKLLAIKFKMDYFTKKSFDFDCDEVEFYAPN